MMEDITVIGQSNVPSPAGRHHPRARFMIRGILVMKGYFKNPAATVLRRLRAGYFPFPGDLFWRCKHPNGQ